MIKTSSNKEEYLKGIVNSLPEKPGIYQYFDKNEKIIYVGKAKNLKKRVSSYFNREHETGKTKVLVTKIEDIKYIVVNTEEDALLLENNLIKKHQPRYNVLLKDDKTYPSICISNEPFPRIIKTRKIIKGNGLYFGPYSHTGHINALLKLIKQLYQLRTCRLNLTKKNIEENKFKACLEYHIKNCAGPCIGEQTEMQYNESIAQIKEILKGNTSDIEKLLKDTMLGFAEQLKFEEAQKIKEKILLISNYKAYSEVVSNSLNNIDVFSIEEDNEKKTAFINYLHIRNGAINQAYTFEYKRKLEESLEELLTLGIIEMRERYKSHAKEIIVPFHLSIKLESVNFVVPQKGEKKKLLDLSLLNVKQYKADRLKQSDKLNPEQRYLRILKELQESLKLDKIPFRIECFDNSNIQGEDAVAGCVVFIKGKPAKKEYRKYIIKTVKEPDDYASMKEVIKRKYSDKEGNEIAKDGLPDLIITDGGKGQMNAVKEALNEIGKQIPVAGLAKDGKHRTSELLYGNPIQTIGIKSTSQLFHFLTQIQDEVHRFAIKFHREKRSKRQTESELDKIKGIGEKTRQQLISVFKSVKRIEKADTEEIEKIIGKAKAKIISNYFLSKNNL